MLIVPGHIPILTISHQDLQSHQPLFDSLSRRLAARNVQISLFDGGAYPGNRDDLYNHICAAVVSSDLVIAVDTVLDTGGRLELGAAGEEQTVENVYCCRDEETLAVCTDRIVAWLNACIERTPLYGCILIGGKSSRMGRPKHLIETATGHSWLERSLELLRPFTVDTMVAGEGLIPAHLDHLARIRDLPGISGPLSGIGSALRTIPLVSWLVIACDMPDLSSESISWLLSCRRPGMAAVIPRNPRSNRSEPLGAWYDFRSGPLVEAMVSEGELRIRRLCRQQGVYEPDIPEPLCGCWRNVNRPDELEGG